MPRYILNNSKSIMCVLDESTERIVMNKTDLIAKISDKSQLTKKDSEKALNAFVEAVTEAVAADDKVQLIGFGTFECRRREKRSGRDPRSGKPIEIPASNTPAFKAGKAFKDAVNSK